MVKKEGFDWTIYLKRWYFISLICSDPRLDDPMPLYYDLTLEVNLGGGDQNVDVEASNDEDESQPGQKRKKVTHTHMFLCTSVQCCCIQASFCKSKYCPFICAP